MGLIEDAVSYVEGAISSISPTSTSGFSFGEPISIGIIGPISNIGPISPITIDLGAIEAIEFDIPTVPTVLAEPIIEPIIAPVIEPIQEAVPLPPVLDTQIEVVPQDLAGLSSEIQTLSGQMISLQQQIESIEFGLGGLESQVGGVSTQITGLGGQITAGFEGLGTQITGGFEGVMSGLGSLGEQIASGFTGITDFIAGGLSGLEGMLAEGFGALSASGILKWVLIIGGIIVAGVAVFYLVKVFILKKGVSSGLGMFKSNPTIKLPGDIKIKI